MNEAVLNKGNEKDNAINIENREKEIVDELVAIRKASEISQVELAKQTGIKQQALSRIEKKENGQYLRSVLNIAEALGYDLVLVKK